MGASTGKSGRLALISQAHEVSTEILHPASSYADNPRSRLRAHRGEETVSRSGAHHGAASRTGKRPVAIIEDEKELLAAYSSYLRRHGYDTVYTFVTGEDFLRAIESRVIEPELVLVDYRLPGEDGIEVAKTAVKVRTELKVIVTTADDALLTRARRLGFDFLQKPFSLATLALTLDRI